MCSFCGYVNYQNIIKNDDIILKMTEKIKKNKPNSSNIFINKQTALGFTKLTQKDINNNRYEIVYDGKIYNGEDLRNNLISKGYTFYTTCDTEVILTCFIEFGKDCVNMLNGTFAFVIYDKQNDYIFLARDRLGVKPLFYSLSPKNTFVFSSEIKGILEHPEITPIIDKYSLMEIFGLGPAHTPGKTFFKDIFEIEAGYIAIYKKDSGLKKEMYWDLTTKECNDTEKDAIEQIHYLVTDATKKQLVSDDKVCSMLSGGLDSSILSKIANDATSDLTTFSIDFKDNDKNFTANSYQMTKDSDYVKIMKKYLNTDHRTIQIDNKDLFYLLEEAVIARDMPGMADIDTSMFAFCKNIKNNGFNVCLSGECSDEIFGGYPWYYKEHLITNKGFPWALSENLRVSFVKSNLIEEKELKEYIYYSKQNTLKNVEFLNMKDDYENRFRQTNYLTIKWFMNTLIERTDRMSRYTPLEVRIPFADHRIFEYVYNLPAKMKLGLHENKIPVEKYLLRKAFENELPEAIVYRKKSPFPKTYDPIYLNLVETKIKEILNDKNSKINNLINTEFVKEMLNIHGENITENLFGQLMTYPQTLAYLIQINMWLDIYDPEFEI